MNNDAAEAGAAMIAGAEAERYASAERRSRYAQGQAEVVADLRERRKWGLAARHRARLARARARAG